MARAKGIKTAGFNRTFLVLKVVFLDIGTETLPSFNRTFLVLKGDNLLSTKIREVVLIAPFWY